MLQFKCVGSWGTHVTSVQLATGNVEQQVVVGEQKPLCGFCSDQVVFMCQMSRQVNTTVVTSSCMDDADHTGLTPPPFPPPTCGMTLSSAATTSTTMSVTAAPRARMEEKAACPGVSRKVSRLLLPGSSTSNAPMCCKRGR